MYLIVSIQILYQKKHLLIMKKVLQNSLMTLMLTALSLAATAERMTIQEYVDYYRDIAISEMHRTGIPASIKLGQGILESDAGNSSLSRNSNNHFGIKCKQEWTGLTYYHKDDDLDQRGNLIESCFRSYYSSYESYIDHSEFLSGRDRYQFLFTYHHTDYKQWAYGLKIAGYATAMTYAENLIGVIERHNLAQYDYFPNPYESKPVVITHTFKEGEELAVFGANESLQEVSTTHSLAVVEEVFEVARIEQTSPFELFPTQTKEYFEINGVVAVSSTGKTLDSIATATSVKLSKLLKYNELESAEHLIENQYVFLGKKQKKFKGNAITHVVQKEETLYIIAQRYGIQLKKLSKMNELKKDAILEVGQVIIIK